MAAVVVPFRAGKQRLELPDAEREVLALAMLGDVVAACRAVGPTVVVTPDDEAAELARELGAQVEEDPGGGQGRAVAAALTRVQGGPVLVVNADLPCVVPRDLRALLGAVPPGGLALVEADDGSTNALALSDPGLFAPLYGSASAARFRDHAAAVGAESMTAAVPNAVADVDTLADVRRVAVTAGPRTQAAIATLGLAA
ncbi:MAG: 2-phospho-L-lactate guanylyltransferase [Thermoleophilia bacterium]|nr:2-phospho-L-lactate guanylyltransferase [Thermoleophilia bacterium]